MTKAITLTPKPLTPKPRGLSLTQKARSEIAYSLRVAASQLCRDARHLRDGDYRSVGGLPCDDPRRDLTADRLARGMEDRAANLRELAEVFDLAPGVVVLI